MAVAPKHMMRPALHTGTARVGRTTWTLTLRCWVASHALVWLDLIHTASALLFFLLTSFPLPTLAQVLSLLCDPPPPPLDPLRSLQRIGSKQKKTCWLQINQDNVTSPTFVLMSPSLFKLPWGLSTGLAWSLELPISRLHESVVASVHPYPNFPSNRYFIHLIES